MEQICVIGLGYIGLPTASILATKGLKVLGVDVNTKVVETINRGEIHIYEPDLDVLVKSAVHSGNLTASTKPASADVFIIAVPTPFKDGHVPDISFVEAATRSIAPHVKKGNLVILESTSPIGTTEKIAAWLSKLRPDIKVPIRNQAGDPTGKNDQIYIAHCPERVLPGQILKELLDNDRIVGGIDINSTVKAKSFYASFVNGTIHTTDARTAEFVKLVENSFRDVNIAFANELSEISDKVDINVWELIRLANFHPRVNILQPGPGVGGHCIAVDPWFIVDSAPEEARLIRMAREVNDHKPHFVINKVKQQAKNFRHPKIACLGLSFKADIDDLRESPAVEIIQYLAKTVSGDLLVVEPHITELPTSLTFPNVTLTSLEKGISTADIVLLLVNHQAFNKVTSTSLQGKIFINTRGTS